MKWYQFSVREVFENLEAAEHGLSEAEVQKRLKEFGPNRLAEAEKIGWFKILVHQFASPLIYILIVAAVVTGLLQEYKDTGVIAAVVVLNALIGFLQEYKAERSVRALKEMVVPKARVLRDGREHEIDSQDLVPGDIVVLASGTRVPADLRLFQVLELKIEEAMLTGESIPAEKTAESIPEENLTPGDQRNMAFMGTAVVNGRARGVVVETGPRTVLGSIAKEVTEISALKAPLQEKIDRFAKTVGLIVLIAAVVLFLVGLLLGENVKEMFLLAVAAAVSAIPEGLPIVVTITLAVGVSRMAARHAIVRKLPAVETLGSTTVICSDKTGTLTKNEMTVKLVFDGSQVYEISGSGYEPYGKILLHGKALDPARLGHLLMLFRIGLLCKESDLYEEEGFYKVDGDPTEGALIVSGLKAGLDLQAERDQYPQIAIIPFESERGFMATLHEHQGQRLVFVKGAPEKLLDMCTAYGTSDRHDISRAANDFARQGLRVLALAYKEVPPEQEELSHQDLETGLIFAGLQGMIDPPRPEAIEAVAGCKESGIRVVMITGDHAITAMAISQELNIVERRPQARRDNEIDDLSDAELFALLKEVAAVVAQQAGISKDSSEAGAGRRIRSLPEPELFELIKKLTAALVKRTEPGFDGAQVLTGKDLEGMTDEELFERIDRVSVYARVSPHHKFRIIQQLINHGEIVAVTGDGVNDAPALKAAHIGVAMGRTGTDVAKEASDMIIADDNFASIYRAVELGRVVFDNIRKVTFFLIPTGVAELLCLLGSVLMGIPMPFLPTQILWINMVTNGLQDVALAFEPGEKGVLSRPPRPPQAGIMSQTLIQRTVLVGLIIAIGVLYEYIHVLNQGYDLARARTIAVTTMVFFQFFQAWNCRSELQSIFRMNPFSNPFLFVSMIAALGAQLAVIYVPFLQWIFRMEPIILKEWFRIGGMAAVIIVVVEIDKLLRRRKALGFE